MWTQQSTLSSKFMPISEVSQIRTNLQIYKTPIKQTLINNNQNYTNPNNYELNYFGTLFSSGNLNQKQQEQINQSPFIPIKDYNFFLKTSLEKSNLKITPGSEYKIHNNENENKNICNKKEETKKNLYEMFNSVKNENKNNSNLFISPQNKIKYKKIFECSASTNNESLNSLRKKKKKSKKKFRTIKISFFILS